MGISTFMGLYVPNWTGLTISAFAIGIILSLSAAFQPETTPYSKFGNRKVDNIPSRKAMLVIYIPSVIACLLIQQPSLDWSHSQFNIVHFLSMAHFIKRVLEVMFVHIYKSNTNAEAMLSVMSAYTLTTTLDLLVVRRISESVFCSTLTYTGVAFVVIGEVLNGYHHYLLREMRLSRTSQKKGSSNYSLPKGALFDYAVAPHYAAEQLTFLGFILISQNIVSLAVKFFPFIYLTVRAKETRIWYSTHLVEAKDKAELARRKNLIPFVW